MSIHKRQANSKSVTNSQDAKAAMRKRADLTEANEGNKGRKGRKLNLEIRKPGMAEVKFFEGRFNCGVPIEELAGEGLRLGLGLRQRQESGLDLGGWFGMVL